MSDLADAYREQRNVWMRRARWRLAERDAAVARAEVAEAALARVALRGDGEHVTTLAMILRVLDDEDAEATCAAVRRIVHARKAEVRRALSGDTPTEPTGDEPRPDARHDVYGFGQSRHDGDACHTCGWQGPPGSGAQHLLDTAAPTQDGDDRPKPHDPPCGWCAACFPERSR